MRDRLGDPKVEENMTEDEQYIESQLVFGDTLTVFGEQVYDSSRMLVYDEESDEWLLL